MLPSAELEEIVVWWAVGGTGTIPSKHDPVYRHADAQDERTAGGAEARPGPHPQPSFLPRGAPSQALAQHFLDASAPIPESARLQFHAPRRGEEFPGLLGTPAPMSSGGVWDGSNLTTIMVGWGVVKFITVAAIWWQVKTGRGAFALVLAASLNLCIQNEVVSLLASAPLPMEFSESFFWRSLSSSLGGLAICLALRVHPFPPGHAAFLFARGFVGAVGGLCLFCSVTCMPAYEATAIYCTAPFWSLLFAWVYMHDRLPLSAGLGLVAAFIGILLILIQKPSETPSVPTSGFLDGPASGLPGAISGAGGPASGTVEEDGPAAGWGGQGLPAHLCGLAALAAAISVGVAGPLIRGMGGGVSPPVLVFSLGTVGLPMAPLLTLLRTGSITPTFAFATSVWHLGVFGEGAPQALMFSMLVSTALIGQICLNWAWQLQHSSKITMVHMALLVSFQFLADVMLGQRKDATVKSDVGLGLILAAVAWVSFSTSGDADAPSPSREEASSSAAPEEAAACDDLEARPDDAPPREESLADPLLAGRESAEEDIRWYGVLFKRFREKVVVPRVA